MVTKKIWFSWYGYALYLCSQSLCGILTSNTQFALKHLSFIISMYGLNISKCCIQTQHLVHKSTIMNSIPQSHSLCFLLSLNGKQQTSFITNCSELLQNTNFPSFFFNSQFFLGLFFVHIHLRLKWVIPYQVNSNSSSFRGLSSQTCANIDKYTEIFALIING